MKEQRIIMGTFLLLLAWRLRINPACVSMWNREYVIRVNRSRDLSNSLITFDENSFVHIARQSDHPNGLADNLMKNISSLMLNNLVLFEKTRFVNGT